MKQQGQKGADSKKEWHPTKRQLAILDVILDPLNRLKTVAEICRLVPCDRKTYYAAFKIPEFAAYYREQSIELTKRHAGQVVNACVREACRGSHNHAKIVLSMASLYQDKLEHTGQITVNKIERTIVDPAVVLKSRNNGGIDGGAKGE